MSSIGGPATVTSGLVLELDAGNIKSYPTTGTTWFDKSGNGYNGTLTNGPTFNTGSGGSIVFDGTNDYVQTTYSTDLLTGYTLSAWFNPFSLSLNGPIIFKTDSVAISPNFGNITRLYINTSGVLDFFWTNSTQFYQASTTLPSANTWYNAVGIYSSANNSISLYLNGILKSTTTTSGTTIVANQPYLIGRTDPTNNQYYKGNISLAQIYNRALSATEIQQNFNATRNRFGI
jgi:hypothetical protein